MNESSTLSDLIRAGATVPGHRPWPRAVVDRSTWNLAVDRLVAGHLALLGLWGERGAVHMALHDGDGRAMAVITLACPGGLYPSVGQRHAPAIRLERALFDLFGLRADGLADDRPWLDHGRWAVRHPLGAHSENDAGAMPYPFLAADGDHLHRIPVGPVHAGIIEPGHFRFTAGGETIVRMEERLGYTHKGIESLLAGATPGRAAEIAGRVSGDSTVAYAYAFALAVESARGAEPPPRAAWLRALMAELERLANHLGDIGAVCNDAAFALMHAHCGILREQVLRAADACFGHRLMRDVIVPGGVARDLGNADAAVLSALIYEIRRAFPELVALYENTTSLQDRTVGTGVLQPALAGRFGAGGFVGRASGRAFDARREPGYAPYDRLSFDVPVLSNGDVNARVWIRIREVEQALALIEQLVQGLPGGAVHEPVPPGGGEGIALVEGFRGDILAWLRLGDDGTVARCHLRDPSWFQWPLLEAVLEGNIVADFPLCNKSFNCSYSGHDL